MNIERLASVGFSVFALSLTASLSLAGSPALAAGVEGKIYEKGSQRKTLLFTLKHEETREGAELAKIHREFASPDGRLAVVEDVAFAGGKLSKYLLKQEQTGERGELELRDGKAWFSYTKEGKIERDDEDAEPNLVIGPTIVPYLQKHWATILKGDDVSVRYAVLERKETVGFKFFKIGETKTQGLDAVQVKMKPTSIVIAALVQPLVFSFTRDGSKLLELEGRTIPKRREGDQWKDLDAETVYLHR